RAGARAPRHAPRRGAGPAAGPSRPNLLGELFEPLVAAPAPSPIAGPVEWSRLAVALRPYEIATIYLDLELGRKVARDLDAHRSVWATAHRAGERWYLSSPSIPHADERQLTRDEVLRVGRRASLPRRLLRRPRAVGIPLTDLVPLAALRAAPGDRRHARIGFDFLLSPTRYE